MPGAVQVLGQGTRPGVGFLLGVAGEDDHQPGVAVRQQPQRLGVHPPFALEPDEPVVQALELLRLVRRDARHGVGRAGDVRVSQHDQRLGRRRRHQAQLGVQDRDQGALAADQRPGHVEAVLGQQRVQVVPGHPSRDLRVTLPDLVGVGRRQLPQGPVDLRAPAAGGHDRGVLLVAGRAGPEPLAVIGEDLEPEDVVDGLAVGLGRRPAGVVPEHAAQRAVIVRGRPRAEHQPVRRQCRVELVQHDARLDHAGLCPGIDRDDAMAVLGPVNDHRRVARLPGQAGTTPAGHHRHPVLTAHRDRLHPSLDGPGDDHADRNLPVVRRIRAVSPPAARVEPHLPIDPPPQVTLQRARIRRRRTAVAHDRVRQRDAGHQRPPGISPIARLPAADSRKRQRRAPGRPPAGAGTAPLIP